MNRLTKLEILNETVKFYSEDVSRRSKGEAGDCVYNGLNGTHCAVGRCLKNEYKDVGEKLRGNEDSGVMDFIDKHGFTDIGEMLEPQYQGHENDFWFELQHLHDTDRHWDEKGLTKLGEHKVKEIKKQFGITE